MYISDSKNIDMSGMSNQDMFIEQVPGQESPAQKVTEVGRQSLMMQAHSALSVERGQEANKIEESSINQEYVKRAKAQIKNMAFRIAQAIYQEKGLTSVSVCPHSLVFMLGMAFNAMIDQKDKNQFLRAFGCEEIPSKDFNKALQELQNDFRHIQENLRFLKKRTLFIKHESRDEFIHKQLPITNAQGISISNVIGLNSEQSINDPTYVIEMQQLFNAGFIQAKEGELAKAMNAFISKSTEGQIENVMQEPLKGCIVNTVTFEMEWRNKFDTSLTKPASFTTSKNEKIRVQTMQMDYHPQLTMDSHGIITEGVRIYQGPTFLSLLLPYFGEVADLAATDEIEKESYLLNEMSEKQHHLYQLVILPQEGINLQKFITDFTLEQLVNIVRATKRQDANQRIQIQMPKLSIHSKFDNFSSVFNKLQLPSETVLERITPAFRTDHFQHIMKMEQNEIGSKGVALSSCESKGGPPPPFIANRPFLYFIMFGEDMIIAQGAVQDKDSLILS